MARACEDGSKFWLIHLQPLQGSKKGKVRLWGWMGKGVPMQSVQTYSMSQLHEGNSTQEGVVCTARPASSPSSVFTCKRREDGNMDLELPSWPEQHLASLPCLFASLWSHLACPRLDGL